MAPNKLRVRVVDGSTLPHRVTNARPLGAHPIIQLTHEEAQLEHDVFGFNPSFNPNKKTIDADAPKAQTGLANVPDHQLFSIDAPTRSELVPQQKTQPSTSHPSVSWVGSKSLDSEPKPAWEDPSAHLASVSLTHGPNRRKKLRTVSDFESTNDITQQVTITGKEYENRLRNQFEKMHPNPAWLQNIRESKRKAQELGSDSGQDDGQGGLGIDQLLRSTGTLTKKKFPKTRPGSSLPKGELEVERLRDANQAEPVNTKSSVSSLQFHPRSSILFTASAQSKRLSFFKIDGVHNPALHFVHTPDLPIEKAEFCPIANDQSTVLMAGRRPYFYTFDLHSCQCIKSPHGLFHRSPLSQSMKGHSLSRFKFSPLGNLVAFVGLNGLIELVDWSNNVKSSQVIASLKSNVPIKSLAWDRNGTELLTIGHNAEVSVWDLRMRKVIRSWMDDGGYNPTLITTTDQDSYRGSTFDAYTAIGSQTGIVNIYSGTNSIEGDDQVGNEFQMNRKPFKTTENVTTAVTTLKFNPDGQILAIASQRKKNALKLVHLESGTIFSNWPTSQTPLKDVTGLSFNSLGNYLAIGNQKGNVLLYNLGWWSNRK